ncbi:MAG TPA: hypothetical protein VIU62_24785 [Chloroflexota bacterium]
MKRISLGVYALILTLLCGLWLTYAPFVVGYQPAGQPWALATRNDLVVAILVIGLSGAGLVGYVTLALREAVRAACLRRAAA